MRGITAGFGSIDVLIKALLEEFPDLDPKRLRAALERATAKIANARMDTEGLNFVNLHLARAEASEEANERADILRDLADNLEKERGDADRALVVWLAAFAEAPDASDLDPLLRLARVTQRWAELPLDSMLGLIDITADASLQRLKDIAAAYTQIGDSYRAADCLERVLAVAPADEPAHDALELFYRSTREWAVLIDLLGRRAVHVDDKDRAELIREIAVIHERELGDDEEALDAFREADRLEPDHPDVLESIARLVTRVGGSDGEALAALERLSRLVTDPKKRASVLFRAADIARLHEYNKAQSLFEQARADDPDLAPAVDGLAVLLRDRGELSACIALLVDAAERPALVAEKARWLVDAADYCVAIGDTDWAKSLYRQARDADPANVKAAVALVELCWDLGSLVELAPILDELCKTTQEPGRLRTYYIQRSKVAAQLGDAATSRDALARAFDLDRHDPTVRRELADVLFENQEWAGARDLIEGLLDDHEDLLETEMSVELHYRVARCARELGDMEGAAKHAAVTLALSPDHRPALLLRTELGVADPDTVLADQLALANIAPPDEKGARFAALGDRYAAMGDRATAREMYREALAHRATDHLLLTKFLGLVADEGDWSYSFDLVQRLIDTEQDPKVRARYRNLAAMIARDELDRHPESMALFEQALEDDPMLFTAADELEAMLEVETNSAALAAFYYRRLGHVKTDEGRRGERLRLWDRLGDLCIELNRRDDAITAFEVALTLDPDNVDRRQRLTELYVDADPKHDATAIHHHQVLLRTFKRRIPSYEALRTLYRRSGQPEKARACDEALSIIGMRVVEEKLEALFSRAITNVPAGASRTLSNDDWLALSKIDVDLNLSALFGMVAPAFAAERARLRPPQPLPAKLPDVPLPIANAILQVAGVFGIAAPAVLLDRDHVSACSITMRVREGALVPVLVIGRAALDNQIDERELAFSIARQLADLRGDRIARLYCPRASDLGQIIELVTTGDKTSHTAKWIGTTLHPAELDKVYAIGVRLRERKIDPARASLDWLAATERAADRIGFVVVGDLAPCVRLLEQEPASGDVPRTLELVWSSVTEDVLAVRGRVEGWPDHGVDSIDDAEIIDERTAR
ncbi:MAG: Tetratricopeptide 2 repeat protein [Myxococcales bacterium]|nr:Tetratricopeptide 2 repeat protein [Myxococcales bacterium]